MSKFNIEQEHISYFTACVVTNRMFGSLDDVSKGRTGYRVTLKEEVEVAE